MYLYVGMDPQEEKQVEKVTALGTVRKDTALLFKGFRQGASNWIHSLLDHNKASAGVCVCVHVFYTAFHVLMHLLQ